MSGWGRYGEKMADFITSVFNEVPHQLPPLVPFVAGNSSANNGAGQLSLTLPRPNGYSLSATLLAFVAHQDAGITPPAGWTLYANPNRTLWMHCYWRRVDDGVNDPPGGYQWTFPAPVEALGGIVALENVLRIGDPIGDPSSHTENNTSIVIPAVTNAPASGFLLFGAFVDKNEDINATGNTLGMTQEFEPRANKNMAVWSQPWPPGGNTGVRSFSISTGIAQDIGGIIVPIKPAQ